MNITSESLQFSKSIRWFSIIKSDEKQRLLYCIRDNFLDHNLVLTASHISTVDDLTFAIYDQSTSKEYIVQLNSKIVNTTSGKYYEHVLSWKPTDACIPFTKGYHYGNKVYIINKHLLPKNNSKLKKCKDDDYGVIQTMGLRRAIVHHLSSGKSQIIPIKCIKLVTINYYKIAMI